VSCSRNLYLLFQVYNEWLFQNRTRSEKIFEIKMKNESKPMFFKTLKKYFFIFIAIALLKEVPKTFVYLFATRMFSLYGRPQTRL
jgi:hypothetical protein